MGKGYGAIEGAEQGEVDHSFDADNLRFLPDEDENLSKAQRVRKYLLVAVPILVAILVVGGAALFLLRDFSHLYPGPGGSSSSSGRHPVYHGGTTPSAPTAPASPPRTPPTVPGQPGRRFWFRAGPVPDLVDVRHAEFS